MEKRTKQTFRKSYQNFARFFITSWIKAILALCFAERFLHLFSLKTPILERFHQRKVTVPCASSMRKGVKVDF
jgi:hypothetical protein